MHKALVSVPSIAKARHGAQTCDPRTQKVEPVESEGHPRLHSELKASLGYMRLFF